MNELQRRSAMRLRRRSAAVGFVALFSVCALAPRVLGARAVSDKTTSEKVVQELCGKTVALLGESPVHGFGRTLEFKVDVTRRLIDECHFSAFFIESGIYDFVNIQKTLKSGGQVTQPMIAAAIGGLWAEREVEPLIAFLRDRAQRRAVILGGVDDQLGRGTYAQLEMRNDLIQHLQGDARTQCLAVLKKHTLWEYTDQTPYGPRDKALISGCLDRMEMTRDDDLLMIASLKRSFARNFPDDAPKGVDPNIQVFNARDQSMYLNFQWLMSRLPPAGKLSHRPSARSPVERCPAPLAGGAGVRENRYRCPLLQPESASYVRSGCGSPDRVRLQDGEVGSGAGRPCGLS